jgi:ABC-type glycerol-3-phosphate transport system substrate-binding protein
MDRRTFLRLAGAGGGAALLAACGASTPQPAAAPTAAPAAAPTAASAAATAAPAAAATAAPAAATGEQIAVSFWTPGGSALFCEGFGTIAQNYEKLHPNIDIGEVQCGVGDQDDYNEILLARIAAGDPPDSTILWTSPIALGARGALEPLDELMQTSQYSQVENWPAAVLASCQFEGKTYGLPATAGSYAIYYNQEMFEQKGIPSARDQFPKTFDELRRISKEFTHWNGDTLETAGFVPKIDAVEFAIWSALNGGQIYDTASSRYMIDSENNIELMQYLLDWLDEEYKGDMARVDEAAAWLLYVDGDGRQPAFQEGKLAMGVQGFWAAGDLYQVEPKFERWDVAQFPVGPSGTTTVSGYWPNWLVIPKGSKQPAEAFKYLDYMTVDGIKVWFANIPDMPANKQAPTDLVPQLTAQKRGDAFALDLTNFFRKQLDIATPMWTSPIQDFSNDQLNRAIEQILHKTATPKDALAEAQQASQSKLEETLKA